MAHILLAEDDAAVRDFVRRALEMSGHKVRIAYDGAEALQALAAPQAAYDLLLADIKMPVMDGIALALRAARDWPELPILLMTGFADQRERAHGLEEIIAGLISKPFTLDEIAGAVSSALESSEK